MRRLWLGLIIAWAAGCAPVLPSETPLGEGPLARAEAKARDKAEKDAEARKKSDVASATTAKPETPPPVAPPPTPPKEGTPKKPDAAKPETPPKADTGKKPGAGIVYAGEYVGSDVTVTKIMGSETNQPDDKARTRVDVAKSGDLDVTFIDSSNGKDICTLHAKPTGKTATFAPGQKCWGGEGGEGAGVLTSGSAKFEDKKLIVEADFDVQGPAPDGSTVSGTIHYRFEGTRK